MLLPGVYTTSKLDLSVNVSVTERLRCAAVSPDADNGAAPSVPSPRNVSPLRITLVPALRDHVYPLVTTRRLSSLSRS